MNPIEMQIQMQEANLARLKAAQATAVPELSIKEQIAAAMAQYAPAAPAATPAPVVAAPAAAVPQEVAILQGLMAELAGVFKKALAPEDLEYMVKHIAEGAPGIAPFLKSQSIVALAQMCHETYREFLAKGSD